MIVSNAEDGKGIIPLRQSEPGMFLKGKQSKIRMLNCRMCRKPLTVWLLKKEELRFDKWLYQTETSK